MKHPLRKSIIIATIMALTFPMYAHAEPETNNTSTDNSITTQIERKKSIDDYINEIQQLDSDIANNTVEIQKNTDKIQEINKNIEDTSKQIDELQKQMKEDLETSGKRIRALSQCEPQLEMIASLFESKSLADLIDRTTVMQRVIKYDSEMFEKAKENKDKLEDLQAKQSDEKDSMHKLLAECTQKSESLQSKKNEVASKLEELKKQYEAANIAIINSGNGAVLGYQSADAKALEDKLKEQYKTYVFTALNGQAGYQATMKANPGIYGGTNLNTQLKFTQTDVIMYATGLLDIPYVWGGTTPSGFDCSGFVQYVYAHFGVYLPRVSQEQQNIGVEINNPGDLQPGDLLFYGDPAHHVTMYVQPGLMMEAPQTGDVVKVSAVRPYLKAMRVVDWSKMQNK